MRGSRAWRASEVCLSKVGGGYPRTPPESTKILWVVWKRPKEIDHLIDFPRIYPWMRVKRAGGSGWPVHGCLLCGRRSWGGHETGRRAGRQENPGPAATHRGAIRTPDKPGAPRELSAHRACYGGREALFPVRSPDRGPGWRLVHPEVAPRSGTRAKRMAGDELLRNGLTRQRCTRTARALEAGGEAGSDRA